MTDAELAAEFNGTWVSPPRGEFLRVFAIWRRYRGVSRIVQFPRSVEAELRDGLWLWRDWNRLPSFAESKRHWQELLKSRKAERKWKYRGRR